MGKIGLILTIAGALCAETVQSTGLLNSRTNNAILVTTFRDRTHPAGAQHVSETVWGNRVRNRADFLGHDLNAWAKTWKFPSIGISPFYFSQSAGSPAGRAQQTTTTTTTNNADSGGKANVNVKGAPRTAEVALKLPCGADLQAALNAARGATLITVAHLQADAKTRCQWGSYELPWRSDDAIVTIQTDGVVPPFGTRTKPGDDYLALFTASAAINGYYQVFVTAQSGLASTPGHPIHGYKFVGLEMATPNDAAHISYGILGLFPYTTDWHIQLTTADFPSNIDVEHCYIHAGNPDQNVARGITFNGTDLRVVDSEISEIHSTFQEANAIWGCDMSGNWTIENNDLQAAGENFFTCGSGPAIPNDPSPKNLTFRYNYVHKPLAWRSYTPPGQGPYIMKNLLELKGWDGAVIDSNVFEYSWDQSQGGYAILFTPRVDGDINRTVRNIVFQNNTLRHMASGISQGAFDTACPNQGFTLSQCLAAGGGADNFTIKNNLFDDISGSTWGGGGPSYGILTQALQQGPGVRNHSLNLLIDHNTFNPGASPNINSAGLYFDFSLPSGCAWNSGLAPDVQITSNIFAFDMIKPCETGPGAVLPGSIFRNNTILFSFSSQAKWDAAFPGAGLIIGSKANPEDQRGANLTQLSALEVLIKEGIRP
jgi:hypothetical protein